MTSLSPGWGFVSGNTFLKIGFSYFYDTSSLRAVCKFSLNGTKSMVTRIIQYDATHVYCFTPPAYLIDQGLYDNGGMVNVSISSNNRDFSNETFTFKYLPLV